MGNAEESIMQEELLKLRDLRKLEANIKEARDKVIEALPIVKEFQVVKDEKERVERSIRDAAIDMFKATGEKKFGQIGIQLRTKYDYDDQLALGWAIEHNLCLSLDKIAFKKQLKVQPLDFVTAIETPNATIPSEIKE